MFTRTFVALLLGVIASPATAQVTVQQPVVSNFGVSTSVSVPDRGTALLGGVSSSASSRSRFGFWPRGGSNFGRSTSHSNVTASVRIHDLRAMDDYLLGVESGVAPPAAPAITARGMLQGYGRRTDPLGRRSERVARVAGHASAAPRSSAQRFWELGRRAEREGRMGVAKLHYEMAARHGSSAARAKLADLVAAR